MNSYQRNGLIIGALYGAFVVWQNWPSRPITLLVQMLGPIIIGWAIGSLMGRRK